MLDQSILDAITKSFAPSLQTIYVQSLDRKVAFREPNVRENKGISKIIAANTDNMAVCYAATLALIKALAADKDFDHHAIDEFDRINILSNLLSNNFFSKKLNVKCPKEGCGHQFVYKVNHGDIIKNLSKMDLSDIVFENDNRIAKTRITCNFPNVMKQLSFFQTLDNSMTRKQIRQTAEPLADKYEQMNHAFDDLDKLADIRSDKGSADASLDDARIMERIKKGRKKKPSETKPVDGGSQTADRPKMPSADMVNNPTIEYSFDDSVDLYIKEIRYTPSGSADEVVIDMTGFDFKDTESVIGALPGVLFTKDDGTKFSKFLSDEFKKRYQVAIPSIVCPECGHDISSHLSALDFFTCG